MNKRIEDCIDPVVLQGLPPNGRVLVAEAWDATPHLETGLEIALRLAASYQKVDYCHYGTLLPISECCSNLQSRLKRLLLRATRSPTSDGIKLAEQFAALHGLPFESISPPIEAKYVSHGVEAKHLSSIEALQEATFYSSPELGISVASSLVTLIGNSEAVPRDFAPLVKKLATCFARSFYAVHHFAKTGLYDAIVIFNGRFATVRGAVLAASKSGIPVYYHERGNSKEYFFLEGHQPHDRIKIQQDIRNYWNRCDSHIARSMAESFYWSKRIGNDKAWTSFKERMQPGHASALIQAAKARSKTGMVVSFFSSSEDEYVSIANTFTQSQFEWKSQDKAFMALAESVLRHGHSLIIRNHPHLQHKSQNERLKWDSLKFIRDIEGINLIDSASSVDTHELIDLSDLVVTYGSTVGIEAVFWGRPSITLRDSFYDEIGATVYKPKSIKELDSLIGNISALVTDPGSSLPYGFYQSSFGIEHQLYRANTLFQGEFLGKDLREKTRLGRMISSIKKLSLTTQGPHAKRN